MVIATHYGFICRRGCLRAASWCLAFKLGNRSFCITTLSLLCASLYIDKNKCLRTHVPLESAQKLPCFASPEAPCGSASACDIDKGTFQKLAVLQSRRRLTSGPQGSRHDHSFSFDYLHDSKHVAFLPCSLVFHFEPTWRIPFFPFPTTSVPINLQIILIAISSFALIHELATTNL